GDLFENDGFNNTAGPRLNPRAVSFVKDYIEKNSDDLAEIKSWGRPYFNLMDAVLTSHNLPKELKYLAVIESELHTSALSHVGARGPWQLMPVTARQLGLKVNKHVDERINYVKSTHAASRYLIDLYNQFGDWLLVIAAYNCGPVPVVRAMKKSHSSNFWDLQYYLPAESRMHVKKFIGTHYIFEGQGGLTTLTKAETDEQMSNIYGLNRRLSSQEESAARSQNVSGKYQSVVIARYLSMDISDFNRYNPNFDKVMAGANNIYEMKLPAEKMEQFVSGKYEILNESIQFLLESATTAAAAAPVPTVTDSAKVVKTMAKK
ncbi:MAG: lytic transglycosylase domain-containing protein, partial [Bacteroidetes bacterium]|nr:lytic transglycosylase domain-containing protein [Bacteroidota bacterium]